MPERWLAVTVEVDSAGAALATEALLEMGGRAVEQRGSSVLTHVPPPEDVEAWLDDLRGRLASVRVTTGRLSWRWQPHEAWEDLWKQGLGVRRVTDRIAVLPSWVDAPDDLPEVTLLIDPGMAFGTAEHPTTRGCLRLLDRAVRTGDRVLDVGSGSAILSIAARRLGADAVTAVELDPYACEAARENLARNRVDGIEILTTEVTPGWFDGRDPVDGIVANMQTHLLAPLLPAFRAAVRGGGWIILSGMLESEWSGLQAAAAAAGLETLDRDREQEWCSGWFSAAR